MIYFKLFHWSGNLFYLFCHRTDVVLCTVKDFCQFMVQSGIKLQNIEDKTHTPLYNVSVITLL